MERALREAYEGLGRTGANPLVGACLVRDGDLLAGAGHRVSGEDHAERRLMREAPEDLSGATLYLTLEPCVQYRRTPPCLPLLVGRGLGEVVVATVDPHPSVNGAGLEALRALGIPVRLGVREEDYRWLSRGYFHGQRTGYPWVDVKLALSADGYLATPNRHSQWITGEGSREEGHRLRARVDAVMVGAGTLRDDDPRLTDRVTGSDHQPKAIVVARSSRGIHPDATLLSERAEKTFLIVPPTFDETLLETLKDRGVTVLVSDLYGDRYDWRQVLPRLRNRDVGRILVEGGATLAGSLVDQSVVRELHLFYSGRLFGNGIPSLQRDRDPLTVDEAPEGDLLEVDRFGQDVYVRRLIEGDGEPAVTAGTYANTNLDWVRDV